MSVGISLVRHGISPYHELVTPDFVFNPKDPDFILTPCYLDLTEEGVAECAEAAGQLSHVLWQGVPIRLGSSPAYRARSTLLVIDACLQRQTHNGWKIVEHPKRESIFPDLRNIPLRSGINPAIWMAEHARWKRHPPNAERSRLHPHYVHSFVTQEAFGHSVDEIFAETHRDVDRRVRKTLKALLSPQTQDHQWVIVVHEESVGILIEEVLGMTTGFQNGQILQLEYVGTEDLKLTLHPKAGVESSILESRTIPRSVLG